VADADITYVEQATEQSSTSSSFGDITGASIASGDFTAGNKYLIIVAALMKSSSASESVALRMVHGTTEFAGSVHHWEPDDLNARYWYTFMVVWTAVSGEAVTLQMRRETTNTVSADQINMLKLKLSDDFTEDTDWFFNEVVSDTTLTTTFATKGTVTFTPGSAGDYLIIARAEATLPDATSQLESRINVDGTTLEPVEEEEGRATGGLSSFGMYQQSVFRVVNLTAVSHTIAAQARSSSTDMTGHYGAIFVLRLDKFDFYNFVYTEDATAELSTTDYGTEVQTTSFTPDAAGDHVILGQAIFIAARTHFHKVRMQVDDSNIPTQDNVTIESAIDALDKNANLILTVTNLTLASHTVALDASEEAVASNATAEDRLILVFSKALAGAVEAAPWPGPPTLDGLTV